MFLLDSTMLVWPALKRWRQADTSQKAAAIAYYAVLSLAPLVLMILTSISMLLGGSKARTQVVAAANHFAGPAAAATAESIVNMVGAAPGATTASLAGFVMMTYFSSAVFYHLKSALNDVWGVPSHAGLRRALLQRLISMLMVLLSVTVILLTMLVDLADSIVFPVLMDLFPVAAPVWSLFHAIGTFILITVLLAAILRHVPEAPIAWGDTWIAAILTTILFTGGNALIGWFISNSLRLPLYGPAGVLIIVLLWAYYGVHMLLFGAHYSRAYAERFGSRSTRS